MKNNQQILIGDCRQKLKEIKKETSKPIVVYPNAGETFNAKTKQWSYDEDEDGCDSSMVSNITEYYDAGATIIGGCCRIRPETIGKVRQILDNHVASKK